MKLTIIAIVFWLSSLIAFADDAPQPVLVKEPKLRCELLRRMNTDQDARKLLLKWMNQHGSNGVTGDLNAEQQPEFERIVSKGKEIDQANTKWLNGVVAEHGWPTISLVGKDGANAAWLLVQHADADPKFQRRCLDLMTVLPKDEVSQSNLAYLTDRVLLAEGKKQLYGTQFSSVDGKLKPRPLEDEANVDHRRADVGLPPLAEYTKLIEQQYSGPKK